MDRQDIILHNALEQAVTNNPTTQRPDVVKLFKTILVPHLLNTVILTSSVLATLSLVYVMVHLRVSLSAASTAEIARVLPCSVVEPEYLRSQDVAHQHLLIVKKVCHRPSFLTV